jgi:DNA polymerase
MELSADLVRAVRQTLESLQLAGVTAIPRCLPAAHDPPWCVEPARPEGQALVEPRQRAAGREGEAPVEPRQRAAGREGEAPAEPEFGASLGLPKTGGSLARPKTSENLGFPQRPERPINPQPVPQTTVPPTSEPRSSAPRLPLAEKVAQLEILQSEVAGCTRCSELAETRTQTVFGVGNPNARLVFVGEAPGADEDAQGQPFVGRAGQLLTDIITKGMKLRREDVYILNVLKCRPPGNRTPAPNEVINCHGFLDRQLEILQPEFICCLGAVAAKAILNTEISIGRLRGKFHDLHGIPVICTYHPAYLLRNPEAKKLVWEDIQVLMRRMGLPVRD